MGWTKQTYTIAATGASTTLTFTSTTNTGSPAFAGPVIDDVVITKATDVAKTHVWHTWTGGPVTSAPAVNNAGMAPHQR